MKKTLLRILCTVMCVIMLMPMVVGTAFAADEPRVLTLSHHCTEDDSNNILFTKFAELVEEKTNGEIKIEIYANGQLYGQAEALEALQLGTLDLGMSDTALWANYDPGCALLDMPYIFKSREHAIKVSSSDIIDPIKERLVSGLGKGLLLLVGQALIDLLAHVQSGEGHDVLGLDVVLGDLIELLQHHVLGMAFQSVGNTGLHGGVGLAGGDDDGVGADGLKGGDGHGGLGGTHLHALEILEGIHVHVLHQGVTEVQALNKDGADAGGLNKALSER